MKRPDKKILDNGDHITDTCYWYEKHIKELDKYIEHLEKNSNNGSYESTAFFIWRNVPFIVGIIAINLFIGIYLPHWLMLSASFMTGWVGCTWLSSKER